MDSLGGIAIFVQVADSGSFSTTAFWLLWPASRHLPPRLHVFIDFLVEHFQERRFGGLP
ncbi:hypothetical protein [Janthinobacterium sp. ROICE36]|uniref:hypothetical protein n=1 Tax=Janthinobacterium sp. ROICE36 TaxID=2048670 RepID=UPI0015E11EC1|nr:hypothetical protein [Janthinobacterium sp. ROICE36]